MRIRLLDRYVGREFLRLFVLFVMAAPLLIILIDVIDKLEDYLDAGLTVGRVALGYVYQFPLFMLWAFPVAALIATVFTINGMTRHSEIAAAKAGGVSFYRLLAPLTILGVLLTGAALGLSEIVPVANRLRAEVMGEKSRVRSSRHDFVYRTSDGHVVAVRRLNVEDARIDGLSLEREGREPVVPGLHVVAREATHGPNGWTLHDGYLRLLIGEGRERTFRFSRLRPATFTAPPDQLLAEPKEPDEMRYRELSEFIDVLQRAGGNPLRLRVDLAQKVAIPVATLIIILFAAPLATSSRRGGAAYGVGASLAITIFYLMLFKVAGAAGASGALDPLTAAWLPNVLFLGAAAVMLARVRT